MEYNARVLIVDDNRSIHSDFHKVLCSKENKHQEELDELERELFEEEKAAARDSGDVHLEYEVDSAYQGQEALNMIIQAAAEGRPYTLAFMDVRMPPGWDGIETICRIWEKYPYIEMVLCTAYSDYTWDEIVEKLGATDKLLFLRKPFDSIAVQQMAMTLVKKWNLGQQARGYVKKLEKEVQARTAQLKELLLEVERKNEELIFSNKALEHAALHDPLTKIPNRALFNDRLGHAIQLATRENGKFALVVMDVNKFKQINDSYGHMVGDTVLKEISQRFTLVLRTSDTVARLGGDEFAIILPCVDEDAIIPIVNKLSKVLEEPIVIDASSFSVGCSFGITFFPAHGIDNQTLIHNADLAMYDAKSSGVPYRIYESGRTRNISEADQLITDLQAAIENNQLSLSYQPIINLTGGQVECVEALCRWIHPEKGYISPDKFIPLAEQKGLIQPLTMWVINASFRQLAAWRQDGAPINLAVNLSVRNFLDPVLPDKLYEALQAGKVNPDWLVLEITESMTMSNPKKAIQIINTFVEMGIHLSIDDFGSGYSSLSYLKKLPVEELKIDRDFVMNMEHDADDRVIVKSTIELAHSLSNKVVAEGVESETVLNILRELGCDKAQGYHICKPQAADDLTSWLFDSRWAVAKAS